MSRLTAITTLLIVSSGLRGQMTPVSFLEPRQISISGGPGLAVAADLNGDGYTDFAEVSTGGLAILLSDGHGGYHSPELLAVPGQVAAAAAGDFNGDGITDLIAATLDGLVILPGLGGGKFGGASSVYASGVLYHLVVADFNRDGSLDLAVTQGQSDGFSVLLLLGNGDGTFRTGGELTFTGSNFPLTLVASDFNADGRPDLLLVEGNTTYGNTGSILWGDGQGHLAQGPAVNAIQDSGPQLSVADVNGDGFPDLLLPWAPSLPHTGVAVLLGNGDGTFRNGGLLPTQSQIFGVVAADVNGDGKLDLAALSYNNSNLTVMDGNGDGTFATGVEYFSGFVPSAGAAMAVAAIFNKGLVSGFATTGNRSPLYLNESSITILPVSAGKIDSPRLAGLGFQPFGIVKGDFNRDGRLDLATGAPNGLAVLLGSGAGTFEKPVVQAGFPGYYPAAVADLNGDGIPDVLVTSTTSPPQLAVFLGIGDGSFKPLGTVPVLTYSGEFGVADVNGDGIPDIVDTSITVYLGKGDGTFGPGIQSHPYPFSGPLVFGDFNGDGKMDIAINYQQGRQSYVLLGHGDGTFGTPSQVALAGWVAAAADLNGDGKLDLVGYTSQGNGTVSVLLGSGDGTFYSGGSYPLTLPGYGFPSAIEIADWNGDGHLDLAAMPSPYAYYSSFLLGDGSGNFVLQPEGVLLYASPFAVVGDLDEDGLPDVLSIADSLWVIRNTSH